MKNNNNRLFKFSLTIAHWYIG